MADTYDRDAEDLGNVVMLEHVNVHVPDQRLATIFYVTGLGLTRDPYLMPHTDNMWINVGRSQFHLPTDDPLVLRGRVGLVLPDREALLERLEKVDKQLQGTKFGFSERNDCVEATCPWGNRFRLHAPDATRFGAINLGMPYVEFDVAPGTADGIARFYREVFGAAATVAGNGSGRTARVGVGYKQQLVFRETDRDLPPFDGHHIQVYVQNFSTPHAALDRLGLITEESSPYQYRFEDIVDPETGAPLFAVEHEVRSMTHPLYARVLVNRNPAQSLRYYQMGADEWAWEEPRSNAPLPGLSTANVKKDSVYAQLQARRRNRIGA